MLNEKYILADQEVMLNKIKKAFGSNKESRKTIFLIFTSIIVLSILSFGIYNLFKIFAAPASIVHDTQAEFQLGEENRLITSSSPEVTTNYEELSADEYTTALWHMDEGSVNTCSGSEDVCDASGNNIHGNFVNNAQFTSNSKFGNYATTYNKATCDYVDFGDTLDDTLTGDEFTISAWVYLNNWDAVSTNTIISKVDNTAVNNDDMFHFYVSTTNYLHFRVYDNDDNFYYAQELLHDDFLQSWHFVTGVYSRKNKTVKIFLDGDLFSQSFADVDIVDEPNVHFVIGTTYGAYYQGISRCWDGKIDEVRVSNIARTDEEIKALAQRRNYGIYTSDVLDLGAFSTSIDDLQWSESSVETGDGEIPYSTTSMIGSWKFNEVSGITATDDSGQGNNGTLGNFSDTSGRDVIPESGWTSDNRKWGSGAVMFDGTDDYIEAGTTGFSGNTGTIEFWFNSYWNVSYRTLATIRTDLTDEMTIFFIDGSALVVDIMDKNQLFIKSPVKENVWNHVVVTWNSGTIKGYFNGVNTLDDTYTGTITQSNIVFGSNITKDANFYQGTIDAVRLYSRVLPESEIKSNYQAGQIEFQTRTGPDMTPNDGNWENWSPINSENELDSLDLIENETRMYDTSIDNTNINHNWHKLNTTYPGTCDSGAPCSYGDGRLGTGTAGKGDVYWALASSIIKDNDTYRLWYSGAGTFYGIYNATSSDGLTWTKTNNNTPDPSDTTSTDGRIPIGTYGKGDVNYASWVTVIKDENTYKMWYSGGSNSSSNYSIYYATSPDSLTWTKYNNNIPEDSDTTSTDGRIPHGTSGKGDEDGASSPSVIKDINTYKMWYIGKDSGGIYRIYYATSNDGLTWTKYNNNIPSPSDTVSTDGRIALGTTGKGDEISIRNVEVIKDGSIYKMWYTADNPYITKRVYYATSNDGLTWRKYNNNIPSNSDTVSTDGRIALGTTGSGDENGVYDQTVIKDGNKYRTWYTGKNSLSDYATYHADFFPLPVDYNIDSNINIDNNSFRIESGKQYIDGSTSALWHLDETNEDLSGNDVFDETSNNYDGELEGTAPGPETVDGIFSKARDFNGTDDKISIPSNLGLGTSNITIEMWVNLDSSSEKGAFMKIGNVGSTTNNGYAIGVGEANFESTGNELIMLYEGVRWIDLNANIGTGWHYIVMTIDDSGTAEAYIDGISIGTSSGTAPNSPDNNTRIGGYSVTTYQRYADCLIDEVRVSDIVRTAEEISESYRMGRDHILQKSVTSTDISNKTKLPFWIASDEAGTYIETYIAESSIVNIESDAHTNALLKLEEDSTYCTSSVSGCIKDSSANNLNGTPAGTPFTIDGVRGKAWDFDGVDDHITYTSDPINASGGTIAFWIRTDLEQDTSNDPILTNRDDTSNDWEIYISKHYTNHSISAQINGYNTLSTWLPDYDFHHIALTWGSLGSFLYFDGKLVDTQSGSVQPVSIDSNLTLGWGYIDDSNRHFNGALDEIVITDNQLSASEVRQIYELDKRTHTVTFDFEASLDSENLITGSGDTSFTINSIIKGFINKGDNLYEGDKIIIKENREGTEFIAQGTVITVNESTGAVTVSSWDPGSTFCTECSPTGFSQYADVFKWQREYFDLTGIMSDQRNSITNITFRLLDGYKGRTIWIDDIRSGGPYLTNPIATNNVTSTDQRYMQYRFVESTNDTHNTSVISDVTINYNEQIGSNPVALVSNLSGHGNIYPGKEYNITSIYSDMDGASNLDNMYLRIENPSGTDIEYYAEEGSNGSGLSPIAVSGSVYITSITYDRSVNGTEITIIWHITVKWDWNESANLEYEVRATDDDLNDSEWDSTDNDYTYENDLTFYGTISVTGAVQGSMSSGDWVQASESINWTGIRVVFDGTSNQYPEDSDFDVRITDDDDGSWDDTTSSGEDINIDTTSDAVQDTEDIHDIDIIGITSGGSDVSNESFTIKVDDTTPDIVDITGDDEALWQNTNSGPIISWTDPTSPSDDNFYITNDGSEPTNSNYDYSTTDNSYDLPNQGEGEITIRVRPQNGANTYGITYSFLIKYDESGPTIDSISSITHPTQTSWYIDDTPEIAWTSTDIYSGVEATWRLIDQVAIHDASFVITNGTQDIEDSNWTSGELSNGTWYFHLAARDNVTNTSNDSFTINIDDTDPTIDTITSSTHPNQLNWYEITTANISWTTSDSESGVEGIWRELDQVSNHSADYVINNGSSDIEDGDWNSEEISEGTWYFHIAVRNNSGLDDYDNFTLNIDASNPIIDSLTSSSHPNESQIYSDNTPTFIWETSDSGSGVESVWRIIDQTDIHDANYVINNGTIDSEDDNWTSGELNSGTWYMHLAARDNAGKTSYDNFKVNIDTAIPDIVDITGANEGVWQNSDSGPVISWNDPASVTDDTFFITNDGSTPTNSNYTYQTSNNSYDLPDQGQGETTIKVRPQNGIGVYGITRSFIIRYDSIAPLNVSNLKGSTLSTNSIKLTWENPSSSDFDHVMIRRKTRGIPLNISDGTSIYEGDSNYFTDSNLSSGTKYYYSVYVYDLAGNYSSGSAVSVWTFSISDAGEDLEELTEDQEEDTLIDELTETGESTEEVEQEELEDEVSNILIIIDEKEIEITRETSLHAYADSEAEAKVPLSIIKEGKESLDIVQVLLISGDEVFIMKLDENQEYFTSRFKVPSQKGQYDLNIIVIYSDETTRKINLGLEIDPYGYIFSIHNENRLRIKDAKVTLYEEIDNKERMWESQDEDYPNPQYTDINGEYSFFVDPGKYKVKVEASGYKSMQTDWLDITNRTIEQNIELKKELNLKSIFIMGSVSLVGIAFISGITILLLKKYKKRDKKMKEVKDSKISKEKE